MSWLGIHAADLAYAIEQLCLSGLLSSHPAKSGVTFLLPSAEVQADIVKHAFSESAEEAIKLVKAHIIPTFVGAAGTFENPIGSLAGVLLTGKAVKTNKAKLAGKVEVELETSFKPLGRENIAIWKVTDGKVPTTGEAFDVKVLNRRPPRVGGDGSSPMNRCAQLTAQLLDNFKSAYVSGGKGIASAMAVFIGPLSGLLSHLSKNDSTSFLALKCVLDPSPMVSWFIAMALVPEATLASWDCQPDDTAAGATCLREFFANPSAATPGQPAAIFTNPAGVKAASGALQRRVIESSFQQNATSTAALVWETYAAALASNCVGAVAEAWPAEVAAVLAPLKAWQDLLRNHIKIQIQGITSGDYSTRAGLAEQLCLLVCETLPGKDPKGEFMKLCGGDAGEIAAGDKKLMTMILVNSTDFMYFPRPVRAVTNTGDMPLGRPGETPEHDTDFHHHAILKMVSAAGQLPTWQQQ